MNEISCPICGQYIDVTEVYQQGRADAIDDVERELLASGFIFTEHALEVWHQIAEQLKEQAVYV